MPPIYWRPTPQSCSPATTTSCRPTSTFMPRTGGGKTLFPVRRSGELSNASSTRAGPTPCAPCILSPSLTGRSVAGDVDRVVHGWTKASDHAPIWIELGELNS